MVQNPKGGGLSSTFGGGQQQIGGVKSTTDFLDKSTWTLATLLLALILISNVAINRGTSDVDSKAIDADETTTALPLPVQTTPSAAATVKDSVQ